MATNNAADSEQGQVSQNAEMEKLQQMLNTMMEKQLSKLKEAWNTGMQTHEAEWFKLLQIAIGDQLSPDLIAAVSQFEVSPFHMDLWDNRTDEEKEEADNEPFKVRVRRLFNPPYWAMGKDLFKLSGQVHVDYVHFRTGYEDRLIGTVLTNSSFGCVLVGGFGEKHVIDSDDENTEFLMSVIENNAVLSKWDRGIWLKGGMEVIQNYWSLPDYCHRFELDELSFTFDSGLVIASFSFNSESGSYKTIG